MATLFWVNDPNILISEISSSPIDLLFVSSTKTVEKNLNALSRSTLIVGILVFFITFNIRAIYLTIFTLIGLIVIYKAYKSQLVKSLLSNSSKKDETSVDDDDDRVLIEGFQGVSNKLNSDYTKSYSSDNVEVGTVGDFDKLVDKQFSKITKRNPLGNVLLTDINGNVDKKPAPPSFNPIIKNKIIKAFISTIQFLNPGINVAKTMYSDDYQKHQLDSEMRNYYSMPNTKILSDQGAFIRYLYGKLPSCKGGDSLMCRPRNSRT